MLITADQVSVQTGQTYTGADLDRVNSFIDNVSAAIEVYCRHTFTDPVPGAVQAVALMEVRRLLNSEPGVATERISDLSTSYAYGGAAFVLSSSAKSDLLAYLRWTRGSVGSIRIFSPTHVPCVPAPYDLEVVTAGADVVVSGRTCNDGLIQVQYSTDGFEWIDLAYTASSDISDGLSPYWRATLPGPQVGTYKFRARFRFDEETSAWCQAIGFEVP